MGSRMCWFGDSDWGALYGRGPVDDRINAFYEMVINPEPGSHLVTKDLLVFIT